MTSEAETVLVDPPGSENRRQPRRRTLKKGLIVSLNKASTFDCTIRNLSGGGAMLVVPDTTGIPNQFELRFDATPPVHHATVRWRNATALGVSFDD